jgi:hypothetical protein
MKSRWMSRTNLNPAMMLYGVDPSGPGLRLPD